MVKSRRTGRHQQREDTLADDCAGAPPAAAATSAAQQTQEAVNSVAADMASGLHIGSGGQWRWQPPILELKRPVVKASLRIAANVRNTLWLVRTAAPLACVGVCMRASNLKLPVCMPPLQKLRLGKKMVGCQLYGEVVSKEPQISFDGQGTCHVVFTLCETPVADKQMQFFHLLQV
jgi:hypothetical protein